MTTEDALPVVAWFQWSGNRRFLRATRLPPLTAEDEEFIRVDGDSLESLVRKSDALAALTLVQAERDAALVDAESWRQQADSRTADALRFGAERDAMQQERDELRAALRELVAFRDDACKGAGEDFSRGQRVWQEARAALTPKATQPTSEASRGR